MPVWWAAAGSNHITPAIDRPGTAQTE